MDGRMPGEVERKGINYARVRPRPDTQILAAGVEPPYTMSAIKSFFSQPPSQKETNTLRPICQIQYPFLLPWCDVINGSPSPPLKSCFGGQIAVQIGALFHFNCHSAASPAPMVVVVGGQEQGRTFAMQS